MNALKDGIAFVDVGWIRAREIERFGQSDEAEVTGFWDRESENGPCERATFDSADDAVAWARERAPIVLVRVGPYEEDVFSADDRPATHELPEYGGTDLRPYPVWRRRT